MAFITATPRTLEAIRKADQIKPAMQKTSSDGSFMPNGGSLMPSSNRLQLSEDQTAGLQLYGQFIPYMSGDYFFCSEWWPSSTLPEEYAGYAFNYEQHLRRVTFRPTSSFYCIEAKFQWNGSYGWQPAGKYEHNTSWLNASDKFSIISGGFFCEPICYLLSGNDGFEVVPTRFGTPIELHGVWL